MTAPRSCAVCNPDQNISKLAQLTRERNAAIARAEAAEAAIKQYLQQVTCEWHDLYNSGIYKTTCGRKYDKITKFCPNCGGAVIIKAHPHKESDLLHIKGIKTHDTRRTS